jgi:hypothetical protein
VEWKATLRQNARLGSFGLGVAYQTHDHTVYFYLVGISDDQLRAANYHLISSRFVLSSEELMRR